MSDISQEHHDRIRETIKELLTAMGISSVDIITISQEDRTVFMIITDHGGLFTGTHEAHIGALQTLVRHIVLQRHGITTPFSVDVNHTRSRKRDEIAKKAATVAERARSFQSTVQMDPMPAYERFIVHNTLSNVSDIETYSEGRGRERYVVIRYRGNHS